MVAAKFIMFIIFPEVILKHEMSPLRCLESGVLAQMRQVRYTAGRKLAEDKILGSRHAQEKALAANRAI